MVTEMHASRTSPFLNGRNSAAVATLPQLGHTNLQCRACFPKSFSPSFNHSSCVIAAPVPKYRESRPTLSRPQKTETAPDLWFWHTPPLPGRYRLHGCNSETWNPRPWVGMVAERD